MLLKLISKTSLKVVDVFSNIFELEVILFLGSLLPMKIKPMKPYYI